MTKPPPRVAVYARYSSDLQNPSSIDDQISLCCDLARQHFGVEEPALIFHDSALSGASVARPGLAALMDASGLGSFEILVAEGLDRISRSLADIARIYQTLQHQGIRIWTAHEGEVGDLHIGFKGTMNALYLKDLKDKVKRAHRAAIENGRAAAGAAYGYRVVKGVTDERGRYVNGLREIDSDQAAIVLRIFQEVADGIPVGRIAKALNDDGIPSPSGGVWRVHSIRGERCRGKGILNNEIYRGWLVYNRTRKVVDPDTGRRRYVPNPESEWIRKRVTELQIVPDELWNRVQGNRPPPRENKPRTKREKPLIDGLGHTRPLTGLVKCGWCGGQKSIANKRRYVCDTYRFFKRRCKNARGRYEAEIAAEVFSMLLDWIDRTEDLRDRIQAFLASEIEGRAILEKEAEEIGHRIERLLNAIERGVSTSSTTERVLQLEARLKEIRRLPPLPDVDLPAPEIRERLRTGLNAMRENFDNQKVALPIHRLLALVVDKIELTPTPGKRIGEDVTIQLKPNGWPEFYLLSHAEWPKVGEDNGGPGTNVQ